MTSFRDTTNSAMQCEMTVERLTGHNLRVHNVDRVELISSALILSIKALYNCDPDLEDYVRCCRLYAKSTHVLAEIQRAIDKAVRLGVDSKNEHERVRFRLENILILGEHLVEHSYDIMSDAARIYQHSHKDSKTAPDISIPKNACTICLEENTDPQSCQECGRDDYCAHCHSKMDSCPFCRTPF